MHVTDYLTDTQIRNAAEQQLTQAAEADFVSLPQSQQRPPHEAHVLIPTRQDISVLSPKSLQMNKHSPKSVSLLVLP